MEYFEREHREEEGREIRAKMSDKIQTDILGRIQSSAVKSQAMEVLKIILKRGKIFRNIMVHVDLEGGQVSQFAFESENS